MTAVDSLYRPTDVDAAHALWGASCGPAALAAVVGRNVNDVRHACEPYSGYLNFYGMQEALLELDVPHLCLRRNFKQVAAIAERSKYRARLSLIQWHGSWMKEGVHIGAALSRTHWIAFNHEPPSIYDVNADGWISEAEWRELAAKIMKEVKGCDGTWSTRGTILIVGRGPA